MKKILSSLGLWMALTFSLTACKENDLNQLDDVASILESTIQTTKMSDKMPSDVKNKTDNSIKQESKQVKKVLKKTKQNKKDNTQSSAKTDTKNKEDSMDKIKTDSLEDEKTTLENETTALKDENIMLEIEIGNNLYTAILYDNESVKKWTAKLPLTLNMSELNGNEKYYFMSENLPINAENIGEIHTGDLMLYGSDCLVLFYKDFKTSYRYTKLGRIEDVSGLKEALGKGSVQVTFKRKEQ